MLNRLEVLDHHFEHHFSTLQDNVDDIKGKLDKREKEAEDRIKVLEELMKKEVGDDDCTFCFFLSTCLLINYTLIYMNEINHPIKLLVHSITNIILN